MQGSTKMKTAGSPATEGSSSISGAPRHHDRLTAVTVGLAGLIGVSLALLMPPFQFNDEHGHFARAYQLSRGEVAGHRDRAQLPAAVLSTLLRYPEGVSGQPIPRTSVADLFAGGSGEFSPPEPIGNIHELRYLSWGYLAYQIYWPVCYLPASAGIRITRLFNLSPISMLYVGRLMNLLSFLAALTLALRLAPGFRVSITGLALMPMTLQQAVAVSADSVTIAFALVGFALVLRTREQSVDRRYLAIVLVTVPLWAMCKNSVWVLPLLLLIPASQFKSRGQRAAFVVAATLATMGALGLWRLITYEAFSQLLAAGLSHGISFESNARIFLSHPFNSTRCDQFSRYVDLLRTADPPVRGSVRLELCQPAGATRSNLFAHAGGCGMGGVEPETVYDNRTRDSRPGFCRCIDPNLFHVVCH